MIEGSIVMGRERAHHRVDAVCPARALTTWHETGDGMLGVLRYEVVFHAAAPPGDGVEVASEEGAVGSY